MAMFAMTKMANNKHGNYICGCYALWKSRETVELYRIRSRMT
jgi:hypothetical protein